MAVRYFLVAEWNMISPGMRMCIAFVASGLRMMRCGTDRHEKIACMALIHGLFISLARIHERFGGPKLSDTAWLK